MSDAEKKEAGSTQGEITEEIQTTERKEPRKRVYKDFGHDVEKPTRAYSLSSTCAQSRRSSFFFSNLDANVDMSKVKINCTIHFTCKR